MNAMNSKTGLYFIQLHKWRSIVALVACVITLGCSIYAIDTHMIEIAREGQEIVSMFRYFTNLSNSLTATASAFIIPYAINGIRMKRFIYPKWLSLLHYAGTICTTLTFIFAMTFIMSYDKQMAVGGHNLFLHVICPIAVFICFEMVEDDYLYTWKDMFVCLIPFFAYSVLYITQVVFIGEENGGWHDLYKVNTFVPFYVSFPAIYALAIVIAMIIRKTCNDMVLKSREKMLAEFDASIDPIQVESDIFCMGRYCGIHDDKNDFTIPYDMLDNLSQRFSMDVDDLMNMYTKGISEGLRLRSGEDKNKKS